MYLAFVSLSVRSFSPFCLYSSFFIHCFFSLSFHVLNSVHFRLFVGMVPLSLLSHFPFPFYYFLLSLSLSIPIHSPFSTFLYVVTFFHLQYFWPGIYIFFSLSFIPFLQSLHHHYLHLHYRHSLSLPLFLTANVSFFLSSFPLSLTSHLSSLI